jgi:uncharacterized membrane protein YhaH (DUF805 family)
MSSQNPYDAPQFDQTLSTAASSPARQLTWKEILFSFGGRIPRRTFWGASILILVAYFAIVFALVMIFGDESGATSIGALIMYVPLIWSNLALQIKRWHDRDKSGWWVLIGLIPLIGPIWAFVETGCLRGTVGDNQYGADPT